MNQHGNTKEIYKCFENAGKPIKFKIPKSRKIFEGCEISRNKTLQMIKVHVKEFKDDFIIDYSQVVDKEHKKVKSNNSNLQEQNIANPNCKKQLTLF